MCAFAAKENTRPGSINISIASYSNRHTLFYADQSATQKLHLILPEEGEGPYPLIVFVHGGSFSMGNSSGDSVLYTAAGLLQAVEKGYAVALVDYRYWPEAFFPQQIQDVKAAIRFLRANAQTYNLKTDSIALWGESAGGLIADMVGLTNGNPNYEDLSMGNAEYSSEVQAVVSWYAITDMTTSGNSIYANALMGSKAGNTVSLRDASPLYHVTENAPVFYLQHGTGDNEVSYQDSVRLYEAIRSATGNPLTRLDLFEGINHAVNKFLSADNVSHILDWLEQALTIDLYRPLMAVSSQESFALTIRGGTLTAEPSPSQSSDCSDHAFRVIQAPDGALRLYAENAGGCLTVTGDTASLSPYAPEDSQRFTLTERAQGYEICSLATGKPLGVQGGKVNLSGEGDILFRLLNVTVSSGGSGLDLSLNLSQPLVASCAGSGLLVKIGSDGYLDSDCLMSEARSYTQNLWQLTEVGGYYSIRFVDSGEYLTESNQLLTTQAEFTSSDSQLFTLKEVRENTYKIICKKNNFLISEKGGGSKDVHTYPDCGVDAQVWVLQNVDPDGEVIRTPDAATVDFGLEAIAMFGSERLVVGWSDGLTCQHKLTEISDPMQYAWKIKEVSSRGAFRILLPNGKYLSVENDTVTPADYNSASDAQLWKLTHIDGNTYQINNLTNVLSVLHAGSDDKLEFVHRKLATKENSTFELLNVSDRSYSTIASHYKACEASYGLVGRWFETKSGEQASYTTINAGSEIYFQVKNTSTVQIHIDIENNAWTPYYAYQIDEGAITRIEATQSEIPIALSKGEHIVRIIVDGLCEHESKWKNNVGFTFVQAQVDEGGSITGVLPVRRTIMFFGDSITEGVNALSSGAVATSNAATKSYSFFCAEALGAVTYRIGFGASGVTKGGSGGVPKCLGVIDAVTGSIPANDPVPDVIVINHGFNDTAESSVFVAEYHAAIARLREKYPDVPIFCVSPFYSRSLRAEDIQSAMEGVDNAYYIDGGMLKGNLTTDGVHPNAKGGQRCGEYLAEQLESILGEDFFALNSEPEIAYGDPNEDGKIDAADALLALQHSVQLITLEGKSFTAADVDNNGVVDASDALYILQKSVRLISSFPAEEM